MKYLVILLVLIGGGVWAELTMASSSVMQVQTYTVDVADGQRRLQENMYLLYADTGEAALIDPGARSEAMEQFIHERQLRVQFIINTHGHWDHIGSNHYYAQRYQVSVYGRRADQDLYLQYSPANLPDQFFEQQQPLRLAGVRLRVFATPGHTEGSLCLYVPGKLFTGDTLFRHSIGRTWGDTEQEKRRKTQQIIDSIATHLLPLPDQTWVYPGHGPATTIAEERANNPFLKTLNLPLAPPSNHH